MSATISRKLRASDIPSAMQLSAEAGWNQSAEDWRMLLELSPGGCLGIEVDGDLATTTTLLCYGNQLAWIGMVLTKGSYRGRGFARRLLSEALALADQMEIATVKLDATDQGQPLYEKLGFRCEQPVERWIRPASAETDISPPRPSAFQKGWKSADHRAFGVDRSELLEKLALRNPPLSMDGSFLLTRSGRVTDYLGPCVADSPTAARALAERALHAERGKDCSWDVLPNNPNAVTIARDFGFTPKRHLMRMVRGKELRGDEASIYAIAGFELG